MKLCDTCIYRNNVEQLKPCIIYRDDCEFYEKERGDMSREEAIRIAQGLITDFKCESETMVEFCNVVIEALKQEPKTGYWIDDKCSVCGKGIEDLIDSREWYRNEEPNFCPFCGIKMQEVEE